MADSKETKEVEEVKEVEEGEEAKEKAPSEPRFMKAFHKSIKYRLPGVRFFKEVSRSSIVMTELEQPFKKIGLYSLDDVDIKPLDTSKIPPEAWPYPTCLFVSSHDLASYS